MIALLINQQKYQEAAGATVISHKVNRGVGGVAKTLFKYAKKKMHQL